MFDDIPPLDDPTHHPEPYPQNPTQVTPQSAPAANHGYFPYMMPPQEPEPVFDPPSSSYPSYSVPGAGATSFVAGGASVDDLRGASVPASASAPSLVQAPPAPQSVPSGPIPPRPPLNEDSYSSYSSIPTYPHEDGAASAPPVAAPAAVDPYYMPEYQSFSAPQVPQAYYGGAYPPSEWSQPPLSHSMPPAPPAPPHSLMAPSGFVSPSMSSQFYSGDQTTPLPTPNKQEAVDSYDHFTFDPVMGPVATINPHHHQPPMAPQAPQQVPPQAPPQAPAAVPPQAAPSRTTASAIVHTPGGPRRYRVIRGMSAGGSSTRPPKVAPGHPDMSYVLVDLQINGASPQELCYPQWSEEEKLDHRRIIRIERIQQGNKLIANFSIVGAANDHPVTLASPEPGVDVVEVSCLECSVRSSDDPESSDDEDPHIKIEGDRAYQYYITSVEVIEIVELLIGTQAKDSAERRRERGRVRSNLVPFWSKRPISSRMNEPSASAHQGNHTNLDFRVELAKRIMGYEIRKPRGFDKEVRILRWDKLVPALKRALQSYYTEIPPHEADQLYG
ncbi:hypothetical protein DIURU_000728 [Diutina rugosa]|uniref:DUF7082 domain-containing protein n=1 Tax=Diutina rugosa TaxID=5481 RepID=A0A642UYK0_DIURU|nr:uncharacterized protein DIURU_000728 [Diutina rugosa]KAA8907044.1 hypothetical protein DIURU_000728 [Diutina rugosa]